MIKYINKAICIMLISMIIIYSFSGCGSTHKNDNDVLYNEANSKTVFAMDTVMELTVYGDEKYLLEAENLIHMLEKKVFGH